jgi:hypothetical protein
MEGKDRIGRRKGYDFRYQRIKLDTLYRTYVFFPQTPPSFTPGGGGGGGTLVAPAILTMSFDLPFKRSCVRRFVEDFKTRNNFLLRRGMESTQLLLPGTSSRVVVVHLLLRGQIFFVVY